MRKVCAKFEINPVAAKKWRKTLYKFNLYRLAPQKSIKNFNLFDEIHLNFVLNNSFLKPFF